jgi:manganese transport protein
VGASLGDAHGSVTVPGDGRLRRLLAFAGPGYMVAVGYMDPGNWATDLAGGSRFGYALLSVVLLSSLMAMMLQALSLRLGIVTGLDLAQACRRHYARRTSIFLWVLSEISICACDLAEVLGTAIALQLLFGIPLTIGVVLTVLDTFVVLALQRRGWRHVEAFVIGLLTLVGACFAAELVLARPALGAIAAGLVPSPQIVSDPAMLYIAIGIVGATVMPHNLYLHSALAQTRRFDCGAAGKREAIRLSTIDSTVALTFAFAINAAILILAAATFNVGGHTEVAEIEDAYRLLTPLLGLPAAGFLFALALLASGQNATLTATLAGQVVMEGFVGLRLSPALRRLATRLVALVPAVAATWLWGASGTGALLVFSQVVLSLQLPFAVVPLVRLTSRRRVMGDFVNGRPLTAAATLITALIIALNAKLILDAIL